MILFTVVQEDKERGMASRDVYIEIELTKGYLIEIKHPLIFKDRCKHCDVRTLFFIILGSSVVVVFLFRIWFRDAFRL